MRSPIFLILLLALMSACTLQTADPYDPPVPTTAVGVIVTQAVLPTETPRPTNTQPPAPTKTNPPAGVTLPACTPRADWAFTYTVVSGDTLGKIAEHVRSTVETLRQGNCLRDANQISVGQILRVPQAPVTNTPVPPTLTPTSTQSPLPEEVGGIGISEYISGDAEGLHLLRDSVVTVSWVGAPAGLFSAEFVLAEQGFPVDPNADIIRSLGTDPNPADGVSISWTVPAGLQGEKLLALGRYANSMQVVSSFRLFVSSAPAHGQGCEIGPASGSVNTYNDPDYNSGQAGVLMDGWFSPIMGRSLDGWYALNPSGGPVVTVPNLHWLPPDGAYATRGNC
jgi:LysM repeat protein